MPSSTAEQVALEFFDPELAAFPRADELVRLLLGTGSSGECMAIAPTDEDALLSRLAYHRLLPQLGAVVAAGQVAASERLATYLESSSTGDAMRGLRLEGVLVDVGEVFARADVEFLVLKGVATGRLDHVRPGLRAAADVDVLVHVGDVDRAGRALAAAGFDPPDATAMLMDKGETWRGPLGVAVDVHTRPHTAGRSLGEDWWDRSETFCVAGHEFRALERGGRMAHAASHYALSFPNHRILTSLLDLVTISRLASNVDRARADQFLAEVAVSDIVHRVTHRAVPLVGDADIVLGRPGSRPLDVVLRKAYDRADLDKATLKLAKTLGMPAASRLRVLRNWVAPTDEFLLRGGYASRGDRVKQVLRRMHTRETADGGT